MSLGCFAQISTRTCFLRNVRLVFRVGGQRKQLPHNGLVVWNDGCHDAAHTAKSTSATVCGGACDFKHRKGPLEGRQRPLVSAADTRLDSDRMPFPGVEQ